VGRSEPRPPREPARAELASAIEAAAKAESDALSGHSAVARASAMVAGAEARLKSAQSDVIDAKEAQAARLLTAVSSGTATLPDRSVRDARAEELDASDNLEACLAALVSAQAAAAERDFQLGRAREHVADAASVVLAGAIEATLAKAETLRSELHSSLAAVNFLHSTCFKWPPTDESRRVESHLYLPPFQPTFDDPMAEPWRRAFDALQRDADALLPS
jgi:hypothetical protein